MTKDKIKTPMDEKAEETKPKSEMDRQNEEIKKSRTDKFRKRIAEEKQLDEDDPLLDELISENDKIKPAFNISIDNQTKLNIWIPNAKSFKITDEENKIIFPFTTSKNTSWHSSTFYRNKLIKAIKEKYDLKDSKAQEIIYDLSEKARDYIQFIIDNPVLSDEIQAIFDSIEKVKVTRQDREGPQDTNIFEIYFQDEIIKLTDEQLYTGPREFCLQYFNRFFHRLIIDPADWGLFYEKLKEEKLEIDEDKLQTTLDIVVEKFLKYIGSKVVRNWQPVKNRQGYVNSVYYDTEKNIIKISSQFMNEFFKHERISKEYHLNTVSFASKLNNEKKSFLVDRTTKDRIDSKSSGKMITWWNFNPNKLEISREDIIENDDEKSVEKESLDFFGDENE